MRMRRQAWRPWEPHALAKRREVERGLRAEGETYRAIAKVVGVSHQTVANDTHGFRPRKSKHQQGVRMDEQQAVEEQGVRNFGPPKKLTAPLIRKAIGLYYGASPGQALTWAQVGDIVGVSERSLRRRKRDTEWLDAMNEANVALLAEAKVVALTRLLHEARCTSGDAGVQAAIALAKLVHAAPVELRGALLVKTDVGQAALLGGAVAAVVATEAAADESP